MQSTFAEWEDTLMSVLPGATKAMVELNFWNTARLFYRRSRSWRDELGPFTLKAGRRLIPISPVTQNTDVCYLEGVYMPGVPIYMRVADSPSFFVEGMADGIPARIGLKDAHTLVLTPAPSKDYERALWVMVSVQPMRGAETLPPAAATHHFTALECGTLGRLLAQVGKPWYNPGEAALNQRRFEVEIGRARADAEVSYGKVAASWGFNQVPLR
jgi:hypothetical protein